MTEQYEINPLHELVKALVIMGKLPDYFWHHVTNLQSKAGDKA